MVESSQTTAEPVGDHEAELKNPDGTWKYTNALIDQSSPYLLQHAHNPVNWYPWGPEAFKLARDSAKPIFLSVGYSTCYWCHVMERQVFENPQLAALLNEHFINIKVDREERPDVDDIYMTAVQMMTQHGGWPMSVFLTPPGASGPGDPGLKPFWAGTYIPPEPRHGIPGIAQVIEGLSNAWNTQRNEVIAQADHVARVVKDHLSQKQAEDVQPPSAQLVQTAATQILRSYDADHGGFGGAPKFPQPTYLLFLMRVYRNNPDPEVWHALAYTLERMARGGMYDQVGGGFHRYSTDGQWLVPHFEKMLYDNAQLVEAYLTAHEIQPPSQDPTLYARVVRETCDYVLREMTQRPFPSNPKVRTANRSCDGVFYSAQDAEVDAREGLNYLWTRQQVVQSISKRDLANLAVRIYGLDQGTNFQDPHHPDEPRSNVLYLPKPLHEMSRELRVELEDLVATRKTINRLLLEVREKRDQPTTDDKTIVAWNGMMIAALARAGAVLNEPRYTEAATTAADVILTSMRTEDGGLYRTLRRGKSKIPAFLEDYAFFVHSLIELHRATRNPRWLQSAKRLTQLADQKFSAQEDRGGGYYDTLADQADLFVRTVSVYDGAIPSGNSQTVHNLLDLYELTGHDEYLDRAVSDLHAFAGGLGRFGQGMSHMHHALLWALEIAPDRFAQPQRPTAETPDTPTRRQVVSVDVEPKTVNLSGGQAELRVTIDIGPDYHLNTNNPGVAGLIPTSLELHNAPDLKLQLRYPSGHERNYPFADQPLHVFEGKIELVATLTRSQESNRDDDQTPRLILRYQVCTENSCLEPKEIELPVTFDTTR